MSFQRPAFTTVVALALVVVSSGGVAYAAENTLPGDALYGVKVSVTEPIRVALARTPAEKVAVHQELAERRIDEAATLANKGKLTDDTEAELALAFAEHADAAVVEEDDETSDTEVSEVSEARFTSRLAAYEEVLAHVDAKRGIPVTKTIRAAIQNRVSETDHVAVAETARATATLFVAPAAPTSKKQVPPKTAARFKTATDEALHTSADLIGSADTTLDASSSEKAHEELGRAQALAEQGRKLLEENDQDGASEAFQNSLSAAARLQVLTHAAAELNINTFGADATTTISDDDDHDSVPSKKQEN